MRAALLAPSSFDVRALEDHAANRAPAQQPLLVTLAQRLVRAVREGAGARVDLQAATHLLGALLVNAFGTRSGHFGAAASGEADGAGLFSIAALFNHSCQPSCYADLSLRALGFWSFWLFIIHC